MCRHKPFKTFRYYLHPAVTATRPWKNQAIVDNCLYLQKLQLTYFYIFSGAHGDDNNFDGPGFNLAHAFLPGTSTRDGDIHMDADENWTENFLYNVAVHEIGHSIGLGHSGYPDSVMFNTYTKTNPMTSLHQDDIEGVKKIYGKIEGHFQIGFKVQQPTV